MQLVWSLLLALGFLCVGIVAAVLEALREPPKEPRIVRLTVRPDRADRSTVNGVRLPKPLSHRLHEDPEITDSFDRPVSAQPHFSRGEWS